LIYPENQFETPQTANPKETKKLQQNCKQVVRILNFLSVRVIVETEHEVSVSCALTSCGLLHCFVLNFVAIKNAQSMTVKGIRLSSIKNVNWEICTDSPCSSLSSIA
jgi:hypothetical protein